MSELYEAIYIINLPADEITPVSTGDMIEGLRSKYSSAKELLRTAVREDADSRDLDAVLAFVDTDTLPDRLKGRESVVCEFVSSDSGILNKPARLTPEEYAVMKTHSVLSGQMVKILLEGVEEESLVRTAYRLARHHHERWDGKGYPDGLVGETIPLEARIMAVADVYDALVSKRVYKEPMSFEQAARIMCEGMGTQFDPNMRVVFLRCRKDLEQYYAAIR